LYWRLNVVSEAHFFCSSTFFRGETNDTEKHVVMQEDGRPALGTTAISAQPQPYRDWPERAYPFWEEVGMDKLVEQEETTPKEYAIEIESPDEASHASEGISPSGKPEPGQSAQFVAEAASPSRSRRGGGPRTRLGKGKSSRNAITHGIFAKVTLLDDECHEEYDVLLQGFREYFQPMGTVEDVYVEELATLKWRYRRLLQAERAEIQSERKFNSRALEREQQETKEAAILEISGTGKSYGLIERRGNPLVLGRTMELLESLRRSIEAVGFDPKNDREIITKIFGDQRKGQLWVLYELYRDSSRIPGVSEFKDYDFSPEVCKANFLGYLRDEINGLKRYQKMMKRSSEEREQLECQSAGVPEASRLDRLLRYGASLQRDFDRGLNQLERLQRNRKGQPVLPTLNVNVST
jgi:hypothetical protein